MVGMKATIGYRIFRYTLSFLAGAIMYVVTTHVWPDFLAEPGGFSATWISAVSVALCVVNALLVNMALE